jgi:glycosyltransferase involved in cell wall biosynthesis
LSSIVFISNYYNHHQSFLSNELDVLTHHHFYFIETMPIEDHRKKMGWGQEEKPPYVLQAYNSKEDLNKAKDLILKADAVIWGSCPFSYISPRLKAKKLTFAYSERLFKTSNRLGNFLRGVKYYLRLRRFQKKHYLLCASAYAALDYNRIGLFKNKSLKWGYFPELKTYCNLDLLLKEKETKTLLWVSRLISWKHPEIAINIAKRLKSDGYDFSLKMIGVGDLESACQKLITENDLDSCVQLLGAMTPGEVRQHMETSSIFLFTSGQNEGWGAVLNEAMNSACVVVANNQIGSVPFLLENNQAGLKYNRNIDSCYQMLCAVLNDKTMGDNYAQNAYSVISNRWNYKVAAKRLIEFVDYIQQTDSPRLWIDGPLSKC